MNEVVFSAAILQPSTFNLQGEAAVNYGGIGAVTGHEISHDFDGDGLWRNEWTDADQQEFKDRSAKLIRQYSQFQALAGLNVNGEFTLGENIGDLGGINIALKAYPLWLDGKQAPILDGLLVCNGCF
jgi:putative endopeptidase